MRVLISYTLAMLGSREKSILEILVREYIKTAEPVSSEKIASRLRHALSPASIRNTFAELTDEGYIEQPHVSGGRVPKDRAYRFYVDQILMDESRIPELPEDFVRLGEHFQAMREMQEQIAEHVRVLSCFGELMPIGFDEIFAEPEFQEPLMVRALGRFLDEFENHRDAYEEKLDEDSFSIMIGEENNIQPTHNISVVVAKGRGDFVMIAGPTRMQYDRIIGIMQLWKMNPQKISR